VRTKPDRAGNPAGVFGGRMRLYGPPRQAWSKRTWRQGQRLERVLSRSRGEAPSDEDLPPASTRHPELDNPLAREPSCGPEEGQSIAPCTGCQEWADRKTRHGPRWYAPLSSPVRQT